MIQNKQVVVVMPAYNAAKTLRQTFAELPGEMVDEVILVDDGSRDDTIETAKSLGIHTIISHVHNKGYGGNQKTCYDTALRHGADIVVMIHPDYQYTPKLCGAMAYMIASGIYDVCLASRILGHQALQGGMPPWKFIANRFLTAIENLLLGIRLSEYHTGYRAFSRNVLEQLPLDANSDDFVFDNEMIAQAVYFGFRLGEISCPTVYFAEASSISFKRSVKYGFGVLRTAFSFWLAKRGWVKRSIFANDDRLRLKSHSHENARIHRAQGVAQDQ